MTSSWFFILQLVDLLADNQVRITMLYACRVLHQLSPNTMRLLWPPWERALTTSPSWCTTSMPSLRCVFAGSSGRAVLGVGLPSLALWDCWFESHQGHGCLSVLSVLCCTDGGLCDGLITRPEESYRLLCVVVCDLDTSWMRRPWPIFNSFFQKFCFFCFSISIRVSLY